MSFVPKTRLWCSNPIFSHLIHVNVCYLCHVGDTLCMNYYPLGCYYIEAGNSAVPGGSLVHDILVVDFSRKPLHDSPEHPAFPRHRCRLYSFDASSPAQVVRTAVGCARLARRGFICAWSCVKPHLRSFPPENLFARCPPHTKLSRKTSAAWNSSFNGGPIPIINTARTARLVVQ